MERLPLYRNGTVQGTLSAEAQGDDTRFFLEGRLPAQEVWCAWVVGEQGELRLGVPETVGDRLRLSRSFSRRLRDPLGRLLRGELRPAVREEAHWVPWNDPFPCAPGWKQALAQTKGVLVHPQGDCWRVALPYDPGQPFPLMELFSLTQTIRLRGQIYLVLHFDSRGKPLFPGL